VDDIEFESNNNELDNYLKERVEKDQNPIKWWKENKSRYPKLFNFFINFLIIPASSTVDERENSQLGRLVTKLRSNLTPFHVMMLNFLKSNHDLW
jgi:hypothetical protein